MLGQIYLLISPAAANDDLEGAELARVAGLLDQVLTAEQVQAVLLRGGDLDDRRHRGWIERLCPLAQQRNCAFLVEDRVDFAAELGCDGVQLSNGAAAVGASRQALGDDMIVGALCGNARHEAMLAGEQGADYVAFLATNESGTAASAEPTSADAGGDIAGLLGWWQEMMTLPCVAFGATGLEDCRRLARAGADFVAVDEIVWNHLEGPLAAVRQLGQLLRN